MRAAYQILFNTSPIKLSLLLDFDEMVGCSSGKNCINEWFHLGCIGLYSVPAGDYICDKRIENGTVEQDGGAQYCTCLQNANFDKLICCTSTNCADEWFHKCCISVDRDKDFSDWICDSCIGKK